MSAVPPFESFLERHRAPVYRFLLVAVGPHDADDCFQETFLSALRAYPRLRDAEHLDRWVLRIASRKALDFHRRARRRPVPSGDAVELADARMEGASMEGATPAPALGDEGELWEAVRSLPPRQRLAVVHRHVMDRSYAEIADLMSCSEQTARANVSQGLRKLREVMA